MFSFYLVGYLMTLFQYEIMQGVSKVHGITSRMSSSYVDNKNISYQHRSGNA
jgi:putative flippase GtrA